MEFDDHVRAVTCVRVMGVLTDLGVKYRVDEDDQDGRWLQVRSPMEESWGSEYFEQLVDVANAFNCEDGQAMVLVEQIGKWYRVVIESNTAISGGMTTAQLGEAMRDAVWGHELLWGSCLERLRAIALPRSSDQEL